MIEADAHSESHDVVVVGSGPAGLAAAVACRRAGLDVLIVSIDPSAPWPATYGCWADEIDQLGLGGCLAHRFSDVRAIGRREHRLTGSYGVFDNSALRGALLDPLVGLVVAGEVAAITVDAAGFHVETSNQQVFRAALVIDARGLGVIQAVPFGSGPRQRAYGLVARFDRPPVEPGTCLLMDWTPPGDDLGAHDAPTFLYGFDCGDGTSFVEETSLARSPAMGLDELQDRLHARLERLGSTIVETIATELVDIPMRTGIPRPGPAVAFGSGGGQSHPATGYSVAASLRAAARLASAIADGRQADLFGEPLAEAAWESLWPRRARRTRALHDYGLATLLGLDASEIGDFFDAFFDSPHDLWRSYLDIAAGPRQIAGLMQRVFRGVPNDVRRALVTADHRLLLRTFTG